MKIKDLFKDGKQVFSLEVFPPKRDYPIETIYKTLDELKEITGKRTGVIAVLDAGLYGSVVKSITH